MHYKSEIINFKYISIINVMVKHFSLKTYIIMQLVFYFNVFSGLNEFNSSPLPRLITPCEFPASDIDRKACFYFYFILFLSEYICMYLMKIGAHASILSLLWVLLSWSSSALSVLYTKERE